jgi:hypothetical protein
VALWQWGIGLVTRELKERHGSGGDITGEIQSLIFQGEIPMCGLNWLCLAMSLLKALFLSKDFL